jgi:hypothetical protein
MNDYPDTPEKRRAGMAAFRARLLKAHQFHATNPKLSEKDRAFQRELVEHIQAVQIRRGEVKL